MDLLLNSHIYIPMILLASSLPDFRALRFSRQCASSLNITNDTNAGVVYIFHLLAIPVTCYNYNQLSNVHLPKEGPARTKPPNGLHDHVFFNALLLLWRKNQEFVATTGLQNHHAKHLLSSELSKKKWCSRLIIISSSNNHPPKILTLAAAPCAVVSPATSSGEALVSTTSASRKSDHFGGGSRL